MKRLVLMPLAVIFGLGCGRVTELDGVDSNSVQDGGSDAVDSSSSETSVPVADSAADSSLGVIGEGCPTDPSALPAPCPVAGTTCVYLDGCKRSRPAAIVYRCAGDGPSTGRWVQSEMHCTGFIGPDGCPLDDPRGPCTAPGKECFYNAALCREYPAGEARHYICTAMDAGATWMVQPNVPCASMKW